MALAQRKKQDDKILKLLREVANLPGNKHCFDCGEKGTTYVNSTIGSFVCTTCSGLLRGLTPPHRIKSISMATFTQDEIDFLKAHGNEECAKTWLGLWDAKRAIKQDHRDFMIDKYERKRYYLEPASPLMSIPSGRQLAATSNNNNLNSSNNSKSDVDNLAVLKSINLTPPSSLRLNKPPSNNRSHLSDTASSTHGSPLFKTVGPRAINGHRLNNNNSSGTASNSSTGSDATNNSANNKFTPDTDFVADFSKIDMFNETVPSTNGNNSSNNVVSSKKNGFVMLNGGDNNNCKIETTKNGNTTTTGVMENFADFEHNQIYNAAGLPMSVGSVSSLSSSNTFNSSSSINSTPSADKYAALKDLDEQFKEIKILGTDTIPITNPQNNLANPFKNPSLLQSALNANTNNNNNNNTNSNTSPWATNFGQENTKTTPWSSATNGFVSQFANFPQTNGNGFVTNQNMFNSNGFMTSSNNQMNGKMNGFNGTSSNSFGFGQGNGFSNPFVAQAGTVNSNNPFL